MKIEISEEYIAKLKSKVGTTKLFGGRKWSTINGNVVSYDNKKSYERRLIESLIDSLFMDD